jgi:hypothetical protein
MTSLSDDIRRFCEANAAHLATRGISGRFDDMLRASLERVLLAWVTRAEALEAAASAAYQPTAPAAADAPALSETTRGLVHLFHRYEWAGGSLTVANARLIGRILLKIDATVGELEADNQRLRINLAAADARIAALTTPDFVASVAGKIALLEGVRAGVVVDFTEVFRREQATLGRGYIGPLDGASSDPRDPSNLGDAS